MSDLIRMLLLAAMGILSHLLFFLTGEHHMQAPKILCGFALASTALMTLFLWDNGNMLYSIKETSLAVMIYSSSLAFSMTIYRLFLHQLHRYPGPVLARISKIWHLANLISKSNFLLLDDLHCQYGDFVRTGRSLLDALPKDSLYLMMHEQAGPNELSICTPEAMIAVHGPQSKCTKAPFYDLLLPRHSIVTTRERSLHDLRRRIWDQAFKIKAIGDYEDTVMNYCTQLRDLVSTSTGESTNASALFQYFAFDVMTDLSFGKSFHMLMYEDNRHIIRLLADGMQLLGIVSPTPWLARIGFAVPGLANGWKKMFNWSDQQMQERLEQRNAKADVTSWLINAMQQDGATKNARDWLDGDGFSIIIAGSDTTSSALLSIFYYLASYPIYVGNLRAEVKALEILNAASLQALPYLNGIINEALRLSPPVPSAGLRQAPPEGLTISGRHIPGNTTIAVPLYSLHRQASCFDRPLEFQPERWFSNSKLMMNRDAFAPFFRGRYGCVGKNLALMELRLVTALLIRDFDVTFPRDSVPSAFMKSFKDHFTAVPSELNLVFNRRI